jgi:LIVCS family branched-chain amino acid:cation transporter
MQERRVCLLQKLNRRETLLVGLTLFSMFFGAGNLIFPPFLGAQAGHSVWLAMIGFALSAIGLPILGVVAVARSGGLPALAGRVGPRFAWVFTLLIYLSIGPGLAIPRTASTSFEMAVTPFWLDAPGWVLPCYAAVFFVIAMLVAFRPDKLTDRLGKVLGPILLVLIAVIVVGCLINAPGGYGPPTAGYAVNAVSTGFLGGYQTMDTIAALNFGIIIALNIRSRGVEEDRSVVACTIRAGWIAGAVLLVVYAALAHVGAVSGAAFPGAANGADVLTNLVGWLYGPVGSALLGAVFVIACLNTCIGLFSCCSEYFHGMVPKIPYRAWVAIFAVISFFVAIAGLNAILAVSVPVLNAIYPVAIVLIALGLTHRFAARIPKCYPWAVALTAVVSILSALCKAKLGIPAWLLDWLPLYSLGLEWIVPAVLGVVLGAIFSWKK